MTKTLNDNFIRLLTELDQKGINDDVKQSAKREIADAVKLLQNPTLVIADTENNRRTIATHLHYLFKKFPGLLTQSNQTLLQNYEFVIPLKKPSPRSKL